ncbi:MAG TPA: tetratricopeptide repeat protein [Planctomycetota bacterium]|nr:tetratricopeptide repeat protein [Planctomycetota bacterium]
MISPSDRAHLAALARVQETRGDQEGLVRTLERDLALVRDPKETLALRKKIGFVYARGLFRRTDAILAYREALKTDPDDDEALEALAALLREGGAWAELAPVLDRRASRARGKDALAIRLELARVLAGKLGRAEEALRMATAARSLDPRSAEAVMIEVEVLRGLGRNDELAEALARLAQSRTDNIERAGVLVELAEHLRTVLKKPDRALRALQDALEQDPTNEVAIERATELQEAMGRWDDLLETYERAYKLQTDPKRRSTLRSKSAEVLEKQKSDPKRAERLYREALAEDVANLAAIGGLARCLHTQGSGNQGAEAVRAQELEALEVKRAELERDPGERAKALARAGDVARDALQDFAKAQAHYEAALQTAPDLFQALAPLAELHYGQERLEEALPLLERAAGSVDLGGDPERAADILHALALCREKKGDREGAAAALRAALEHKASHAEVLEDLSRLLCEDGAFHAAVPILEDLVQRTRVPGVRAQHELQLARALAKTGAGDRALDLYARGLERRSEDHAARLNYSELLLERQDLSAARRELEKLLKSPPATAAKARLHLSEIFETALQDLAGAAKHLKEAVELEGDHRGQAARRLAELLARQEKWGDAAQYLAKAVELEPEGVGKAELYAKLGRLFRDRLANVELARKCLEKSFELVPTDRHTLDSLARLLEKVEDWAALEKAYGKAATASAETKTGDEAASRLKRAEVLWKRLSKPKNAAKELERVLAIEPTHTGARAMLAQVYVETGDVKGIETVYREMIHEDPLAVDHYRALAEAWKNAGNRDGVYQATQAIAVLRGANEEEQQVAKRATETVERARRGLKPEEWSRLVPREAQGPFFELVQGLAEPFERAIPEDLKSYGLGMLKRSLPLEGDGFPEHRLVKRVADLLGIQDGQIDLYWMGDWKRPEAILAHGKKVPALILCPAVFAGLTEAEKAFVVARALALVPARLEAFRALPPRELEKLFLAAVKTLHPDLTSFSGEEEKETRAFMQKVAKALTPDMIEKLRPHAQAIARRADKANLETLRRAAQLVASRAGVLAAGGAYPSVLAVVKTTVALRGRLAPTTAEVVREFREVAELRDILEFSVTEGHLELRKALWLAAKAD